MRKIILTMSISLDGYFEGPNREIDWHLVDEELHAHMNEWLGALGVFVDGRITYELMESVWPAAAEDPASHPPMAEFGRIWVGKPKILYSRTRSEAGWNTTVLHEVVPEDIAASRPGPRGTGHRRSRPGRDLPPARPRRRAPAVRPPGRPGRGTAAVPAGQRAPAGAADRDPHVRQRRGPAPLPTSGCGRREREKPGGYRRRTRRTTESTRGGGVKAQRDDACRGRARSDERADPTGSGEEPPQAACSSAEVG